jgi:hypothetical protein
MEPMDLDDSDFYGKKELRIRRNMALQRHLRLTET